MRALTRIYGYPHEGLHVLALWLVGRRALRMTQTHVDIPDDLTTIQYVFVAGLPALVFWGLALFCVQATFNAENLLQAVLWFVASAFFSVGGTGALGDILLIMARLTGSRRLPPDDERK